MGLLRESALEILWWESREEELKKRTSSGEVPFNLS
jgi:hypothetical protein